MKIKLIYLFFASLILVLNVSCKAKKIASAPDGTAAKSISQKQIVSNYYQTQKDFQTLYLKANVDYQDAKRGQSVSAEIRIDKDKTILVSVRFLGFTVAKALITPDKVQYYEKLGSKYFEGDYSTISEWLGTDLDFQKIQNMILGMPFENLSKGKYTIDIQDNNYVLTDINSTSINKKYVISSLNFELLQQEIGQLQKNRKVAVKYSNHQTFSEGILPKSISILAKQGAENTSLEIDITNIKYNDNLTFPYSVPNGYSKIEMK